MRKQEFNEWDPAVPDGVVKRRPVIAVGCIDRRSIVHQHIPNANVTTNRAQMKSGVVNTNGTFGENEKNICIFFVNKLLIYHKIFDNIKALIVNSVMKWCSLSVVFVPTLGEVDSKNLYQVGVS